jgi:hypothetical protein
MPIAAEPTRAARPSAAAALARAAGAVFDELPARIHPGWSHSLPFDAGALAQAHPSVLAAALLVHFDLRWPDLSAATHALQRIWLLPRSALMQLCAAGAASRRNGSRRPGNRTARA